MSKPRKTRVISKKKIQIMERIHIFYNSVKGKVSLPITNIKEMYGLYNEYYGTYESDYTCSNCAIRIFKRIKEINAYYGKEIKKDK